MLLLPTIISTEVIYKEAYQPTPACMCMYIRCRGSQVRSGFRLERLVIVVISCSVVITIVPISSRCNMYRNSDPRLLYLEVITELTSSVGATSWKWQWNMLFSLSSPVQIDKAHIKYFSFGLSISKCYLCHFYMLYTSEVSGWICSCALVWVEVLHPCLHLRPSSGREHAVV